MLGAAPRFGPFSLLIARPLIFRQDTVLFDWLRPPTYIRFIFLHYSVWVFWQSNQQTEGVAENDDVDVVH